MTDIRDRRIAVLDAAAKAKSQNKTRDAEDAIRRLVKRNDPITFQAVQREAGVSHAFLYNHSELRQRIEHLRARHTPIAATAPTATTVVATTVAVTTTAAATTTSTISFNNISTSFSFLL